MMQLQPPSFLFRTDIYPPPHSPSYGRSKTCTLLPINDVGALYV